MEHAFYIYYILAVLVIGLICLWAIRFATRSRDRILRDYRKRHAGTRAAGSRRGAGRARMNGTPTPTPVRELGQVATPWGWRNHTPKSAYGRRPGFNGALHRFTDRLLREKELVNSAALDPRRSASIRALLEDRYGRVHRDTMTEIEYRKVRVPRLRDPQAPYDQMDNFGTGEAEVVQRHLGRARPLSGPRNDAKNGTKNDTMNGTKSMKNGTKQSSSSSRRGTLRGTAQLKDVKQPWGW